MSFEPNQSRMKPSSKWFFHLNVSPISGLLASHQQSACLWIGANLVNSQEVLQCCGCVCVCVRADLRVLVCVVLIAGSRIQPSVKPQLQTALNHRLQH